MRNFLSQIIFFILILNNLSLAENYYVRTNGSNILNGTSWGQAWKTIGYAASNAGPGDVVTVSNGIYNEQVSVKSNGLPDNYIIFRSLQRNGSIINAQSRDYGFYLDGISYSKIEGFKIKKAMNAGIFLTNVSETNLIVKNAVCSNNSGIKISGAWASNNYIMTNCIWSNQFYGIYIFQADYNKIISNQIVMNRYGGIMTDGTGNPSRHMYIINNLIYSNISTGISFDWSDYHYIYGNRIQRHSEGIFFNNTSTVTIDSNWIKHNNYGFHFNSGGASTTISRNIICSNALFGINYTWPASGSGFTTISQNLIFSNTTGINTGIRVNDCYIKYNKIYRNKYGLQVSGSVILGDGEDYYITGNEICSNSVYGIRIGEYITNVYIKSNLIHGTNQGYGIYLKSFDDVSIRENRIYNNKQYGIYAFQSPGSMMNRNLIYNNLSTGIKLTNLATDIRIFNNTLSGNKSGDGVLWLNSSSGTMYNNIIISNAGYGINQTGSGNVVVAYNDLFGNVLGPTNGNLIWGGRNIFEFPFLDSTTSFTIATPSSPVVDRGTNIPGITDGFSGTAPDIGWKESPYTYLDNMAPVVGPDKPPGEYVEDLDVKLEAFLDFSKTTMDYSAKIFIDVHRDDVYQYSKTNMGIVDIHFDIGYKYTIRYFGRDFFFNTSPLTTAEYDILKAPLEDIAVYPTLVNVNRVNKVSFVYRERKNDLDIRIFTLRGDLVKEIKGANFLNGSHECDIAEIDFLPPGQYIVKIENKKGLFYIIK
ncbi:MAG: right-handed parallel beta-helix repeat-containing protein [Spirochaetes bacterium]|nr:right-handed parallel beta-helix repeat-containing protein [Spirochaetota bacterium]